VKAAVNTIQASGRASSNSTKALSSQAEIPFECTSSVTDASAQFTYQPDYPWLLDLVTWTGEGLAECTIPMLSLEFTIWAVDPIGFKNVIAIGDCVGCEAVPAVNTGYTCVEDPSGIGCDGEWELSLLVVFEAPPDFFFETGTPGCIIAGPVLTCTETVVVGTVPKWGVSLPHDVPMPELTQHAIDGIRATHFPDGAAVEAGKGLFFPGTTDEELETIFESGMKSGNPWGPASQDAYIEKTFDYGSEVGWTSPSKKDESRLVTLVISKIAGDDGGDVITMYPK
jgi:hypothetical protein